MVKGYGGQRERRGSGFKSQWGPDCVFIKKKNFEQYIFIVFSAGNKEV